MNKGGGCAQGLSSVPQPWKEQQGFPGFKGSKVKAGFAGTHVQSALGGGGRIVGLMVREVLGTGTQRMTGNIPWGWRRESSGLPLVLWLEAQLHQVFCSEHLSHPNGIPGAFLPLLSL